MKGPSDSYPWRNYSPIGTRFAISIHRAHVCHISRWRFMMAQKRERGFAAMDPEEQREIASKGGRAAHERGSAHEFGSEEAAEAGRKGGEAVSRDREHMAEIGRKGGLAAHHRNAAFYHEAAAHHHRQAARSHDRGDEEEGYRHGETAHSHGQRASEHGRRCRGFQCMDEAERREIASRG